MQDNLRTFRISQYRTLNRIQSLMYYQLLYDVRSGTKAPRASKALAPLSAKLYPNCTQVAPKPHQKTQNWTE